MSCGDAMKPDIIGYAQDEGYESFVLGTKLSENQYPAGGAKACAWERGWLEAKTYHDPRLIPT